MTKTGMQHILRTHILPLPSYSINRYCRQLRPIYKRFHTYFQSCILLMALIAYSTAQESCTLPSYRTVAEWSTEEVSHNKLISNGAGDYYLRCLYDICSSTDENVSCFGIVLANDLTQPAPVYYLCPGNYLVPANTLCSDSQHRHLTQSVSLAVDPCTMDDSQRVGLITVDHNSYTCHFANAYNDFKCVDIAGVHLVEYSVSAGGAFSWTCAAISPCHESQSGYNCSVQPECGNHGLADNGFFAATECKCSTGFDGPMCDDCARGFFGASCLPCQCANEQRCSDGRNATGVCMCSIGKTGIGCSNCEVGFRAPACEYCMPGFGGETCTRCKECGAGFWHDDRSSDCACVCDYGFTGDQCTTCSDQWQGPQCDQCRSPHTDIFCRVCPTGFEGIACESCSLGYGDIDCQPCNPCEHGIMKKTLLNECRCECDVCFGGPTCSKQVTSLVCNSAITTLRWVVLFVLPAISILCMMLLLYICRMYHCNKQAVATDIVSIKPASHHSNFHIARGMKYTRQKLKGDQIDVGARSEIVKIKPTDLLHGYHDVCKEIDDLI
jgi:hypothetical protein